jgi:signal transduction histidine kinase
MKNKFIITMAILILSGMVYLHINAYSQSDEKVTLDDDWEFYWMQLLSPEEIQHTDIKPAHIPVPSSWRGQALEGTALTRFGYATYRTKVIFDSGDIGKSKALFVPYIGSAYKLWIDGELAEQIGVVGKNREEETPDIKTRMIVFKPSHEEIEVIIQVSNYSFREGGILENIQYGDTKALIPSILKSILRDIMIMGGFLFIGLYHLIIFRARKNELSILLIGLGGIVAMVRTMFVSEYLVGVLVPIQSWEILVKIEYLSELAGFLLLILLMKQLYPKEVHPIMLRISYGVTACFVGYVLLTPARVFTETVLIEVSIMLIILLYFVGYVGIMSAIRKREGARLNLIAFFIITGAMINDALIVTQIIQSTPLLEYSLVNFVFFQAIIISYRYSLLFNKNRTLASELVVMNRTLEEKVTDRTKELNEKNEQLGRMQQTRTRMLANIAHDLGSPIVGIQTYLQLMKEGIVQSGNQEVIQQLYGKSDDMRRLIEDLFELTKLESKAITFDWMEIEVRAFINEVYRKFEPDLINANLALRWGRVETATAGQEAFFHIDPSRINRVIQNFIDNAMKFSRSYGNMITLSCYIVDDGSMKDFGSIPQVRIEVIDQGAGIAPDQLPYIFQRFYKKQEDNESGSGLGLAIVKEIIEQHGGHVGVESELGKGSLFYCTLPIYYEDN